jgi:HSP20 family protein
MQKDLIDGFFEGIEEGLKEWDAVLRSHYTENKLGTPVDFVDEDDQNYYMTIQAAGFKKEDINLTVDSRTISVKGESSHDKISNKVNYYFTAPKNIQQTNVSAHLEHGVLTVTIPKAEKDIIRIEIK